MKYDVFISYSRRDTAKAEAICSALTEAGISFFIDKEGISGGENFPEALASNIDNSRVFMLLASENSYKSKFTKAEILYAFNHLRSGCILPYLIDNSEMPSDLEFLLGNVNWIDSAKCPPSKLPEEVRRILDRPDTGTIGGRKVRRKWPLWALLAVVAVALGALIFSMLWQRNDKEDALQDYRNYETFIRQADSLASEAARLGSLPNTIQTTSEQILALKGAVAAIDKADSVRRLHSGDEHIALFNSNSGTLLKTVNSRLDSMHTAWTGYAKESYNLYKITRSPSERQNVLDCIGHALSIKGNKELEELKNAITR